MFNMLCITVLLAVSLFTNSNLYSPNEKCLVFHYLFVNAYLMNCKCRLIGVD